MFMIAIENMLLFLEYFDKIFSLKNISLRFVISSILSFVLWFFTQIWKDLKEKRLCKVFSVILHLAMWPVSCSGSPHS